MRFLVAVAVVAVVAVAGMMVGSGASHGQAPPRFKVDPAWPQALPAGEILGQVAGIAVDQADDSVWIVHRPRSLVEDEQGRAVNFRIRRTQKATGGRDAADFA